MASSGSRKRLGNYTNNYGQFLNSCRVETVKLIRKQERIMKKIKKKKLSIIFNETCIREKMLPIYIRIYIGYLNMYG